MTTGRRCRTPTGTRRRTTGQSCPAGWVDAAPAPRALPDVGRASTRAPRPAPPAPGTPRAATRRVGSSGASTSRRTPARASRSPSPTPATGRSQGIGVFIDDITLPDGTSTSFETGLDGWAITGPPEGSAPNVNNFIRTDASGFPVGNAIATPHSLLLGFGLEGVSTRGRTQRSDGPGARPPAGLGGRQTPS